MANINTLNKNTSPNSATSSSNMTPMFNGGLTSTPNTNPLFNQTTNPNLKFNPSSLMTGFTSGNTLTNVGKQPIYTPTSTSPKIPTVTSTPSTPSAPLVKATTPILAPTQPNVVPTQSPISPINPKLDYQPFSIDTSTIGSNRLSGSTTPNSVLNYAQKLQGQYQNYLAQQQPLQQQLYGQNLYGPDYLNALQAYTTANQNQRQLQQNYLGGINNVMQRPEAMDFQQGQEAALTRQNALLGGQQALNVQAAGENLGIQEQIRQNNIAATQALLNANQQNYQNLSSATQAGAQYGLNNVDYQQITDPSTGFPTIVGIDRSTGQVVSNYQPGQSSGQPSQQGGYDVNSFYDAIVGQESGGNYGAVSPAGALGKYQIMPATLKSLGYTGTPSQFLNNPQLQDQAFQTLMSNLSQQYNGDPVKMAAAYYGGDTAAQIVGTPAGDKPQKGGFPSINSYVQQVIGRMQQNQNSYLPPLLQQYTQTGPANTAYINIDKVAQPQQSAVKIQAAQNGIPVLSTEEVGKVRNIDVTQQNLTKLSEMMNNVLGSGLTGRVFTGFIANPLKSLFQTDKDVASFKTFRDTAINTIQALAGGSGSGFRLNQSEVDVATSNLPTINDNIETATRKVNLLNSFLNEWTKQILPNAQVNTSTNTTYYANGTYYSLGTDGKYYPMN